MDADRLLDGLNQAQLRAVTSPARPLCVLAGAGSGKTRVLTRRIAWRAATDDLDPRHVLALTFTRKAAGELTTRLRSLGLRDHLAAGTFHAVAYAQLRARWADRGIRPPTLLDRKIGLVARLLPPKLSGGTTALDVVGEIEWAKARLVDPARYADKASKAGRRPSVSPSVVARVFERYEAEKRTQRLVDFDDLLRLCARDLTDDADFAATQRWRFRHVFVDEFQDVNPLQKSLLDAWLGERRDLCVVGDPNQAIYAWNGADPEILTGFADHHDGTEVVRLTDNYRSSPQILAVANAVLPSHESTSAGLTANRPEGPVPMVQAFPDERAEARAIARAVRDRHRPGGQWRHQAILVRTNAQTALIEEALRNAKIPFRVRGGGALLDQPDIKRVLRGLKDHRGELATVLADLEASATELRGTDTDTSDERADNLDALARLGHDYLGLASQPTVGGFTDWLGTTTRADQPDQAGDGVEIATFHSAKGLEWPIVHLGGLEQGLVPIGHARTSAALAEERRLFYVAVTRAERELSMTWARERTYGSRTISREPSVYLEAVEDACARLRGEPARRRAGSARPAGRAAIAAAGRRVGAKSTLDGEGTVVLDALKAWRSDRARAAAVPAYVIFHDSTLEAMAAARPNTRAELLALPGLGPVKVSRYGDELLRLVATGREA
jgi:DNA helicase II / ATP-dependent DNA helicase PcrA